MSERKVPPPCDKEVFQNGQSLFAADTSACGANAFEAWVREVAEKSGQRVDWHFSGGVAHVLFLGDRDRIVEAARAVPCPARIIHAYDPGDAGLYRADVTPTPPNAVGAFYAGGGRSEFIVSEREEKKP